MISGSKCSGSGWSPIGRFSGAGLSSPTDGVVAADARARPGTRWSGGWRTSRSGGGPRCWRSASADPGVTLPPTTPNTDRRRAASRQSPTLPSIISRRMSAWPACRPVSRITCRYTHRNVSSLPPRCVVEAVLGGDLAGAVARRLVGGDNVVELLVRLQPQVGLRVCLGPRRRGQLRGGDLPDLLGEPAQFHPPQVFDQAAEVGAGRHRAAPGVLLRHPPGLAHDGVAQVVQERLELLALAGGDHAAEDLTGSSHGRNIARGQTLAQGLFFGSSQSQVRV